MTIPIVRLHDMGARKVAIATDAAGHELARAEADTPGEAEAKVRSLLASSDPAKP